MMAATMRTSAAAALATIVATAACGASHPLAGAPGDAGATGDTAVEAGTARDECASDGDCPPLECLVAPCPAPICARGGDGLRHCMARARPTLPTCPADAPSCCKSDADCATGDLCAPAPRPGLCGGLPPQGATINQCDRDQCRSDADYTAEANGACAPTYPRVCAYGPCRTNADCDQGPGGACVAEAVQIVVQGSPCVEAYVFCRYADDPCRTDADCGSPAMICAPGGLSGARCVNSPFGP